MSRDACRSACEHLFVHVQRNPLYSKANTNVLNHRHSLRRCASRDALTLALPLHRMEIAVETATKRTIKERTS